VSGPDDAAAGAPPRRVTAAIGIALLLVAAAVILDAQRLPAAAAIGVGPAAAMRLVAVFVALLGVCHLVVAVRSKPRQSGAASDAAAASNRGAVGWVLGAMAGLIAIVQFGGGFMAASTCLFVLTARAFGARIGPKSILIGAVLSIVVYLFFTRGLSLALPAGPLERLLS